MLVVSRKITRMSSFLRALKRSRLAPVLAFLEAEFSASGITAYHSKFENVIQQLFGIDTPAMDAWRSALAEYSGYPEGDALITSIYNKPLTWLLTDLRRLKRRSRNPVYTGTVPAFIYGVRHLFAHLDEKMDIMKRIIAHVSDGAVKVKLTRFVNVILDEETLDNVLRGCDDHFWQDCSFNISMFAQKCDVHFLKSIRYLDNRPQ